MSHEPFEVTVYYEDTDFTGFVYHANYLKFFERAREEAIGIEKLTSLFQQGIHFVVRDIQLRHRKPAKHDDKLVIQTSWHRQPNFLAASWAQGRCLRG